MVDLPEAIAGSDDTDFLRALIQDAGQRLMDIAVTAVCGAGMPERSPDREVQRDGSSCDFSRLPCDEGAAARGTPHMPGGGGGRIGTGPAVGAVR